MLQRLSRAELYRKEANKYADLAKDTTQPDFLTNLFRQTAVRYVLMAEDLERPPDSRRGMGQAGLSTYLKRSRRHFPDGRFAAAGVLAACRPHLALSEIMPRPEHAPPRSVWSAVSGECNHVPAPQLGLRPNQGRHAPTASGASVSRE